MTTSSGVQWSSRLAFTMAAVGCAVGLGNIWLFPYTAGVSGGGAFVLIYLAAVILLALPVLIAELMVGRRGAASPPDSIEHVARESGRSPHWRLMGVLLGVVVTLLALGFYGVVGGWTLSYTVKLASGQFQQIDPDAARNAFATVNGDPGSLLPWVLAFMAVTVYISARGVVEGIEKAVKLLMPALFVMLVGIVIYACWIGDVERAAHFLFDPDFSKVDTKVVLAAFGQAFFSVSVGATNMMTYGSYMDRKTDLPGAAVVVVGADTAVALLAGFAIFPIVFMQGLQPDGGPGLIFQTLPYAFGQIPGGQFIGAAFFLLLFFAALTSSIGMLEPPTAWLRDTFGASRRRASLIAGSIGLALCILGALSFNVLAGIDPLGMFGMLEGKTFFDLFIYIVTQFMMPLGGIFVTIFAGWAIKQQFSRDELFNGEDPLAYKVWLFLVRFVAPPMLAFVLWDVMTS